MLSIVFGCRRTTVEILLDLVCGKNLLLCYLALGLGFDFALVLLLVLAQRLEPVRLTLQCLFMLLLALIKEYHIVIKRTKLRDDLFHFSGLVNGQI